VRVWSASSQRSIVPFRNRRCRPTFWQGSLPSWASLWSVDFEIFRYLPARRNQNYGGESSTTH
jgi:hypothetical protein